MHQNDIKCEFTTHAVGQGFYYTGKISNFHFGYDCGSDIGFKKPLENEINHYEDTINPSKSIGLFVISHFDFDHVSGINNLFDRFTIENVVIPYIPYPKRIDISLSYLNVDEWYYDFLLNPIGYLNRKRIGRIYVICGNNGDFEQDIIPEPPLPPIDRESISNDEYYMKYSRNSLNDHDNLKNRIEKKDPGYKGKVQEFGYSNRFKGDLVGGWKFCFYYQTPKEKIYSNFKSKFKKLNIKNSKDLITVLKKKEGRQEIRNCYPEDSKDINNSSLVLYHSPITFYRATHTYFTERTAQKDIKYTTTPWYDNIAIKNNTDFGQLLTGDLSLKENSKEFFEYFNNEVQDIAVFFVSHHGSLHSWNSEFLEKYSNSAFWIISSGFQNKYGHPHLPVINRIINAKKNLGWSNDFNRIKISGYVGWIKNSNRVYKSKIVNENYSEFPIIIERIHSPDGYRRFIHEIW